MQVERTSGRWPIKIELNGTGHFRSEDDARALRDALTDVLGDKVLVFVFDDGEPWKVEPYPSTAQANAFEKGISEYAENTKTLRWPFDEDEIIETCDPDDPAEMLAECINRGLRFGLKVKL